MCYLERVSHRHFATLIPESLILLPRAWVTAEHLAAAWQSDKWLHLSHSRSALLAEPVGEDQHVPELTEIVDQARPGLLAVAVVELAGSVDAEHIEAAVVHMHAKG